MRKGVPRVEHAKSKQGRHDTVSASNYKKGVSSQDQELILWEHDYLYIVCIFEIYSLFVLSHYLVKFVFKMSNKQIRPKKAVFVHRKQLYFCAQVSEGWARDESRIPEGKSIGINLHLGNLPSGALFC